MPSEPGSRCVSVDGDADRIIYSYIDEAGSFRLLDGDKIATLVAGYLQDQLTKTGEVQLCSVAYQRTDMTNATLQLFIYYRYFL